MPHPVPRQPILLQTSRCSRPSSNVRISLDKLSGRSISCITNTFHQIFASNDL